MSDITALNPILSAIRESFAVLKSDSVDAHTDGMKLFGDAKNSLKETGKSLTDLLPLFADAKEFKMFCEEYNKVAIDFDKYQIEILRVAALKKDMDKFLSDYKRAKEKAVAAGENSCTVDFVPFDVWASFTGHAFNREPEDHVKGDYLKGKIEPGKRDTFRSATLIELDEKEHPNVWAKTLEKNPLSNTMPLIKGDAHCRHYATCIAPGAEGGFRCERPKTMKVTVLFGYSEKEVIDYPRHRGSKDTIMSPKDIRITALKNAMFDTETASKFLLSTWKTAFKLCGVAKGDEDLGVERFGKALAAINQLDVNLSKGKIVCVGVKVALLTSYEKCDGKEDALHKWDCFWTEFFNDEASHVGILRIISRIDARANQNKEAEKLLALYNKTKVEEVEPTPEEEPTE